MEGTIHLVSQAKGYWELQFPRKRLPSLELGAKGRVSRFEAIREISVGIGGGKKRHLTEVFSPNRSDGVKV
tara:strand:+ start:1006 stop:1218 length:213 start_codon:yes stop_codon:yes gene_type:complete